MHIAVVGAGAVGCYLAARLSENGHRLTLVGREDQVAAIARDELLVRSRGRGTRRYRLAATRALAERPDLVLLTVKTQDVEQACREIVPHTRGVPVVAMQNGVQADRLAAAVLGAENVAGAVVMCAATYLQPGEVSVEFPGWLIVGEPFAPGRISRRARAIAAVLGGAAPAYPTRHLARVRWSKLISNLNNGLCAATGLLLGEIMADPTGRLLPLKVMREGYRVVRAAGIPLDHGLYGLAGILRPGGGGNAALVALLQGTTTTMLALLPERAAGAVLSAAGRSRLNRLPVRFSTWQSIARGRTSEIDYLNGEIVRLGLRLGLPTPYNSHLVRVVHQVERSHAFVSVAALLPAGMAPTIAPATGRDQ